LKDIACHGILLDFDCGTLGGGTLAAEAVTSPYN